MAVREGHSRFGTTVVGSISQNVVWNPGDGPFNYHPPVPNQLLNYWFNRNTAQAYSAYDYIDPLFGTNIYAGLDFHGYGGAFANTSLSLPTTDLDGNASGTDLPGYARQAVTFAAPADIADGVGSGRFIASTNVIDFGVIPSPGWGAYGGSLTGAVTGVYLYTGLTNRDWRVYLPLKAHDDGSGTVYGLPTNWLQPAEGFYIAFDVGSLVIRMD